MAELCHGLCLVPAVCPSCIDLSLDLLLCMIMGLLRICCCGHPALSPCLGTGGQCGYPQLLARTRGASSPAVSASRVFYEALTVGNPKLAGGSGCPGVHAVKAKVIFFLSDLILGSPVEVRKTADSLFTKPDLNQSFPWAQKSYLVFFSPSCCFYSTQARFKQASLSSKYPDEEKRKNPKLLTLYSRW